MFAFMKTKAVKFPSNSWLEKADRNLDNSPDLISLETKSHHLVFFCGEQMRSGYEHGQVSEFEFCGNGFTKPRYFHWKKNLGLKSYSIPIIAPDDAKPVHNGLIKGTLAPPARIKGELYLLPTNKVKDLDTYRLNTVYYERKRIQIFVPHRITHWVKDRAALEAKLGKPFPHSYITSKTTAVVNAWIYEGKPDQWEHQLDGGYNFSPVKVFRPTKNILGEYSYFSNREYDDI